MMPGFLKRGRLRPFLTLFVMAAVIAVAAMVGVAWAASPGAAIQPDDAVVGSFSFSAADLGGLGGEAPAIKSPAAVLISLDTGRVLFDHNADERMRMASTTKIMTAVLVIEKLDLQREVRISPSAAATYEPKSWVREGDVLTVDQLLYALMLRSANAAAVALAETCSGTVAAFVQEMNRKAVELGMTGTRFRNPHGLDEDGHYSTAADMALLSRYAMQDERFRTYVAAKTYELALPGRRAPLLLSNTNKLLQDHPWVIGVKTGLTPKAEQCLVAAGRRDGIEVLSVILGQPVSDLCFEESRKLLQYGFSQCREVKILQRGAILARATVPDRSDGRVDLVAGEGVAMQVHQGDEITVGMSLDSPLRLPITAGQACGRVVVTVNGDAVDTVDVVAARSLEAPTLGSKLAYYFARLGQWIGGVF